MRLSSRKFGFEFEHISRLEHQEMADLLIDEGVNVDRYATGHSHCPEGCYSGWQVKSDGSITPADEYPEGIELVSPPLTFKDHKMVQKILKIADKHGGVNSSCGLHVHVEAPELSVGFRNSSYVNIVRDTWLRVEKTLFSYVPASRRNGDYCRSGFVVGDKYRAFNTSPLQDPKRTVEFRLHSATLNHTKAMAWAALCVAFVDYLARQQTEITTELSPLLFEPVPAKQIKTRAGTFELHREPNKWIVEVKKKHFEFNDLRKGHEMVLNELGLRSTNPLATFHYPAFGNAMSKLCQMVGLEGAFRGYLEERYDRMINKFGPVTNTRNPDTVVEDDEDYYNEPDYDENEDSFNVDVGAEVHNSNWATIGSFGSSDTSFTIGTSQLNMADRIR